MRQRFTRFQRWTPLAFAALALVMVMAGCSEPTIKSPWTGREVTSGQLAVEQQEQERAIKAEAAKAEAEMNAALVGLKNRTETDLADIRAKFEPIIASAKDKAEMVGIAAKSAMDELARIASSREGWFAKGTAIGDLVAPFIPGGPLVWGAVSTGLAILFGRKAQVAKKNLTNVVDALDHANDSTPAGPHDAAWDKAFGEWLGKGSKAEAIITAISTRKD